MKITIRDTRAVVNAVRMAADTFGVDGNSRFKLWKSGVTLEASARTLLWVLDFACQDQDVSTRTSAQIEALRARVG